MPSRSNEEMASALQKTTPINAEHGIVGDGAIADEAKLETIEAIVREAERLSKAYQDALDKVGDLKSRERELVGKESSLRDSQRQEEARLKELAEDLSRREDAVVRAEIEVERKELSLITDWADKAREATRGVREKIEAMLEEIPVWGAEKSASLIKELTEQRFELAQRMLLMDSREAEISASKVELDVERTFISNFRSRIESDAQFKIEAIVESSKLEIDSKVLQIEALNNQLEEAKDQIRTLHTKLSIFGPDPEGVKNRLIDLQNSVREKDDELARRPPEEFVSGLKSELERLNQSADEAVFWRLKFDQLETRFKREALNVGAFEVMRDEVEALNSQKETLRALIEQQRNDWEQLRPDSRLSLPFPACSKYDNNPELALKAEHRRVLSLDAVVEEIRNRMALNSDSPFYYSKQDLRIFLAGLACSRLHLLQGISGTGKTSLPREFFKALAGPESVQMIEVQAGWKDKEDLLGFDNSFEKKFNESEFTKALYRALLPINQDRPMVIVLDEMNLSRPEQYFSVMLSKLENAASAGAAHLELIPFERPMLPKYFQGAQLPLAPNIWFVGTANHDETTVAFADKTYDRAHVQVLPTSFEAFSPSDERYEDRPVSFKSLSNSFSEASRTFRSEAARVKEFFRNDLRAEFAALGVGWGNRLERQIDSFVPVVLAAGGNVSEAVDHLVATKLVRKLEDRFGVRPEQLDDLSTSIQKRWAHLASGEPLKSKQALENEARRLREGF